MNTLEEPRDAVERQKYEACMASLRRLTAARAELALALADAEARRKKYLHARYQYRFRLGVGKQAAGFAARRVQRVTAELMGDPPPGRTQWS